MMKESARRGRASCSSPCLDSSAFGINIGLDIAVVEAEATEEVVVEEEHKSKCQKVMGTTKTRGRAKLKPLRRECSRREV